MRLITNIITRSVKTDHLKISGEQGKHFINSELSALIEDKNNTQYNHF